MTNDTLRVMGGRDDNLKMAVMQRCRKGSRRQCWDNGTNECVPTYQYARRYACSEYRKRQQRMGGFVGGGRGGGRFRYPPIPPEDIFPGQVPIFLPTQRCPNGFRRQCRPDGEAPCVEKVYFNPRLVCSEVRRRKQRSMAYAVPPGMLPLPPDMLPVVVLNRPIVANAGTRQEVVIQEPVIVNPGTPEEAVVERSSLPEPLGLPNPSRTQEFERVVIRRTTAQPLVPQIVIVPPPPSPPSPPPAPTPARRRAKEPAPTEEQECSAPF